MVTTYPGIYRSLDNLTFSKDQFPSSKIHSGSLSNEKKLLIGSYFTLEYSIESAALFNPSIVEHPDQTHLENGQKRIILSFRATGEGHISSLVFRSGEIDRDNNFHFQAGIPPKCSI